MMTTIKRFYNKYRNNLELNKNLMLTGTAAFFVGTAVTELYSKYNNNDFWISIVWTCRSYYCCAALRRSSTIFFGSFYICKACS